jgi:hypothetical protein
MHPAAAESQLTTDLIDTQQTQSRPALQIIITSVKETPIGHS